MATPVLHVSRLIIPARWLEGAVVKGPFPCTARANRGVRLPKLRV